MSKDARREARMTHNIQTRYADEKREYQERCGEGVPDLDMLDDGARTQHLVRLHQGAPMRVRYGEHQVQTEERNNEN